MELKKISRPDVCVLELHGSFEMVHSAGFESDFKKMTVDRPKLVGLDFSNVNQIDSSGIASMIKSLKLVKAWGGQMILFGLNQLIMNVFKLGKLENFFKILTVDEFNRKYPA